MKAVLELVMILFSVWVDVSFALLMILIAAIPLWFVIGMVYWWWVWGRA